jgi:hypothetical protein
MVRDWTFGLSLGSLVLACAVSSSAQRMAGAARTSTPPRVSLSSRTSSGAFQGSITGGELRRFHSARPGLFYGGSPLWWDEPYQSSSDPSQVILMPAQAGSPEAEHSVGPAPSQDPLVIELRGDQYVRLSPSSKETSGDASNSVRLTGSSSAPVGPQSQSSSLPTIFVFRDGHREESSDYSIYEGVIHARSDLWTDGAWTKQIPLAALNIAESRMANEERGVRFVLPAAPNEVVTRP